MHARQTLHTVLVVDDHPLLRQALGMMLAAEPWVGRIIEAGGVEEASGVLKSESPSAAIVDLGLPDGHGADVVALLRQKAPRCPVLVLTTSSDDEDVHRGLSAGARGYLLKSAPPDAIGRAVRALLDGEVILDGKVAAVAMSGNRTVAEPVAQRALPPPFNRLSPRDVHLATQLARGRTSAQVARQMNVTEKTVRNRTTHIMDMLGVPDRVQMALLIHAAGLLDDEQGLASGR